MKQNPPTNIRMKKDNGGLRCAAPTLRLCHSPCRAWGRLCGSRNLKRGESGFPPAREWQGRTARLSISGFCFRNNEKDKTNVIARSESDKAILTVHRVRLLRGVYPGSRSFKHREEEILRPPSFHSGFLRMTCVFCLSF